MSESDVEPTQYSRKRDAKGGSRKRHTKRRAIESPTSPKQAQPDPQATQQHEEPAVNSDTPVPVIIETDDEKMIRILEAEAKQMADEYPDFVNPNDTLRQVRDWFQNFDPTEAVFTVNPWQTKKGAQMFEVSTSHPNSESRVFTATSPAFVVARPSMYLFGTLGAERPDIMYPEANPSRAMFSMSALTTPASHDAMADENDQDREMLRFVEWVRKLTGHAIAFMAEHKCCKPLWDQAHEICKVMGRKVTRSAIRSIFASSFVHSPVSLKSDSFTAPDDAKLSAAGDDEEMEVDSAAKFIPFSERISCRAKVFKSIGVDRATKIIENPDYTAPHPLMRMMLKSGKAYNDLPMYNAADNTRDARGRPIPIPLAQRSIEEGDVISVRFAFTPYAASPKNKAGMTLNPVSIIFIRPSDGRYVPFGPSASAPRECPIFPAGSVTDFTELKRDGALQLLDAPDTERQMVLALQAAEAEYAQKITINLSADAAHHSLPGPPSVPLIGAAPLSTLGGTMDTSLD